MIFYFTGTGNTGFVAFEIIKANNDVAFSIQKIMNRNESLAFTLKDDEVIGFVFPTYNYAPPQLVVDFIRRVKFSSTDAHYVFSIATCGVRTGNALRIFERELNNKGIKLNSGFSIRMPNNKLRHGNEGEKTVELAKLEQAKKEILRINGLLENRCDGLFEGVEDLESKLNHSEFYSGDLKKFVVSEECVVCGRCVEVCPSNVVKLVENKPLWEGDCCLCWSCVHNCPRKAIQYGQAKLKMDGGADPYDID